MDGDDLIHVAEESDPSDFFEVRLESLPVPVRVEYSAIRDLRAGFDGNGETIGLLLGSSSEQARSIQHCELLALSPATLGDPKALQGALQQFMRARLRTPLKDAPQLLGCFRTQVAGWPGIRAADLEIAKRNFPGGDPLFLLIQTPQHRPWLAALYALDDKAAEAPSEPALEFPFDEYLLRNGYLTGIVEVPETVDIALRLDPQPQYKLRWILAALFAVILLGGSAAAYKYKWFQLARAEVTGRSAPVAGALGLKVVRSGKDFQISWDRFSAAVQQASEGTLTINDGALTRSVALDGAQLREGQILYTPLFEELNFRLEVGTSDPGTVSAESVRVLAWSGKQPAEVMTAAPSDPSKNSLAPIFAGAAATPPSPLPATKLAAPRPVIPKPESSKKASGAITPAPATKSAAAATATSGTRPPTANTSPIPRTGAVIQPSSPNPAPKQDVAATASPELHETSLPAVSSERPPTTQPAPKAAVNIPPSEPTPSVAPNPVAPAPKPEAAPIRQNSPAAPPSLPPRATVAPPAVPGVSRVPAPAVTTSAGPVFPVPIERVAPIPPRGVPTGAGRVISVRVMVDSAGSVQSAEVVASNPKGAFGEALVKSAALDAARKWKFRPGQLNGKNIAAEFTIDFKFQ